MDEETKQWITAALVFLSGLAVLAVKMLPLSTDWQTLLLFVSAGIDLALTVFFGRAALKTRAAKAAAKAKAAK